MVLLLSVAYAENVILVSDNIADKAIAEVAAKKLGWKVIVTPWGIYNETILEEVIKYNPEIVLIIGGEVAVPKIYEEEILKKNITVKRISGKNRIETAINVAKFLNLTNIVVVNGYDPLSIKKALELAINKSAAIIFIKQKILPEINEIVKKAREKYLIEAPGIEIAKDFKLVKTDIYNETLRLIEYVKERISELREKLLREENVGIKTAVERILNNAERVLNKSLERLEDNKLAAAYNLALSASYMVESAERILDRAALERFCEIFKREMKEIKKQIIEMRKELEKIRKEFMKRMNETLKACIEGNISREACEEIMEELRDEYKEKVEEIVEDIHELKQEFMEEMIETMKEYREKMHELIKEMREKMREHMKEWKNMTEICEEEPWKCKGMGMMGMRHGMEEMD